MSIVQNKKAFHDYFIEEKYETGVEDHPLRRIVGMSHMRLLRLIIFTSGTVLPLKTHGNHLN